MHKWLLAAIAALCFAAMAYAQGVITLPNWTNSTRSGSSPGTIGYNTTNAAVEYYDGAAWHTLSTGTGTIAAGTTVTSGITTGHIVGSTSNKIVDTGVAWASLGTGTVTSVAAGCGTSVSPSPITTTGTVLAAVSPIIDATTANYAITGTSCGGLINLDSASAQTPTLPTPGAGTFPANSYVDVCNIGAGVQDLTPTGATIGGKTAVSLVTNECLRAVSDGTNYQLLGAAVVNLVHLGGGGMSFPGVGVWGGDTNSFRAGMATNGDAPVMYSNGSDVAAFQSSPNMGSNYGPRIPATGTFCFTPGNNPSTNDCDTGLMRNAAGVLQAQATGAVGDIMVAKVQAGVIYSAAGTALPSCAAGINGATAIVSDATAATFRGAYTSGGAQTARVLCVSGTGWITD